MDKEMTTSERHEALSAAIDHCKGTLEDLIHTQAALMRAKNTLIRNLKAEILAIKAGL